MTLIIKCAVILLVNLVNFAVSGLNTIQGSFDVYRIVPNAIPVAPTEIANVTFPSGAVAFLGTELTPTQVKNAPIVIWDAIPDQHYTLLMVDLDGSTRNTSNSTELLHWQVVNIMGNDLSTGETLAQYVGSGPPPASIPHRYLLLVYQQPTHLVFDEAILNNTSLYKRQDFSAASFASKYRLGNPIAGNFYVAKYDSYVPTLYKQLGISKGTSLESTSFIIYVVLGLFLCSEAAGWIQLF